MAKRILGIALSPNELQIAELELVDKSYMLVGSCIESLKPKLADKDIAALIIESLKKKKITTKNAVVTLLSDKISFKLIELPIIPKEEVAGAIAFKIAETAGIPIDQVLYDFNKLPTPGNKGKEQYFSFTVRSAEILRMIDILKLAKLNIVNIIPPTSALKIFSSQEGSNVVLHINQHNILIVMIRNGVVVFARNVSLGIDAIEHALTGVVMVGNERLEITNEKAAQILKDFGVPVDLQQFAAESNLPANELSSLMRPALEKIGAEILRTFQFYQEQSNDQTVFSKVFLTGSAVTIKSLDKSISEMIEKEVVVSPTKLGVPKNISANSVQIISLASGSAMGECEDTHLFPKEMRYPFIQVIKKLVNVWMFVLLVLIIVASMYYGLVSKNDRIQKDLKALRHDMDLKGINIEKPSAAEDIVAHLISEFGPEDNFIDVVKTIMTLTPADMYFESIEYNRKSRINIFKGIVKAEAKDSVVAQFINNLNKTKYYKTIDLQSLDQVEGYNQQVYRFAIKAEFMGAKI